MPHLHVWAELRSPLEEPSELSGRRSIQPDYTLVSDPITSPNSAVVVVECKQYRKFSKRNFSHAVIDYANGRPNAHIVLASYGPVRDDFLGDLASDVASRITLFGHLRPGDREALDRFRSTMRRAIAHRFPVTKPIPVPPIARIDTRALKFVKLSWGAMPRDLDLHLAVWHDGAWAKIDHISKGRIDAFPWAALDVDVRSGHGPETITIESLMDAPYRCYVKNYSAETPLANCGAEIQIMHRDSETRLICPGGGPGHFWHVFDFDAQAKKLRIVNAINEDDPTEHSPA